MTYDFWVPLVTNTDTLNSIDGSAVNKAANAYVASVGDSSLARIEYDNDPDFLPNLVLGRSTPDAFVVVIAGTPYNAQIIGGGHSPQRPK